MPEVRLTTDAPPMDHQYPQAIFSSVVVFLARIAHEVNRVYCKAIGDPVPPEWDDASIGVRTSMYSGALAVLANPGLTPEQNHELWVAHRAMQGWKHGEVKSEEHKTHPNMVGWDQLTLEQRFKDILFTTIIKTAVRDQTQARIGVAGEDIKKGSDIVEREGLFWQEKKD